VINTRIVSLQLRRLQSMWLGMPLWVYRTQWRLQGEPYEKEKKGWPHRDDIGWVGLGRVSYFTFRG